jgi:hypothetical protein
MNAFAAAEQPGKSEELQRKLESLFERQNKSEVKPGHRFRRRFCA